MKIMQLSKKQKGILYSSCFIILALVITFWSGKNFYDFAHYETEFAIRENVVTRVEKFSKYSPRLKGTVGDSNIYVIEGAEPGPSILIIGGTHPNEPAGQVAATVLLENLTVERGTVYIITEANRSAYTHSHPQEASIQYFGIETPYGVRTFKFGSRATNTNQQWPNPDVYVHRNSGQKLSSADTRNLNRAYPGSENGTYTERVAYAITECIRQNNITITIDVHEASPEYQTINTSVSHNRKEALKIAAAATLMMESNDVSIRYEESPLNLHGLTHRELGDYTDTLAFLLETSNASQGKIRGAFTEELVLTGKDKFYQKAMEKGIGKILYAAPVSLDERVARHVYGVYEIIQAYNKYYGTEGLGELKINGFPSYQDIMTNGVGNYLKEIIK